MREERARYHVDNTYNYLTQPFQKVPYHNYRMLPLETTGAAEVIFRAMGEDLNAQQDSAEVTRASRRAQPMLHTLYAIVSGPKGLGQSTQIEYALQKHQRSGVVSIDCSKFTAANRGRELVRAIQYFGKDNTGISLYLWLLLLNFAFGLSHPFHSFCSVSPLLLLVPRCGAGVGYFGRFNGSRCGGYTLHR